jgi:hypothetical protein
MNYLKVYCNLIRKAENRTPPEGYTEKHHVFPKSIFGQNNRLVVLTSREHYIAHTLLEKIYIQRYGMKDKRSIKMTYAHCLMISVNGDNTRYYNSYLYENAKMRRSLLMKGKPSFMLGKKHKEESKRKMSKSRMGRISPKGMLGKKMTDEHKKKIGEANSGKKHPLSKLWKLTFINGTEIIIWGLHVWARENGYQPAHIRKVYIGKYKKHKDIIKVEVLETK